MAKSKRVDAGGMEIVDESAQQQAALDVMMALHEAGFTKLWLDSVRMFTDEATIHYEDMQKLNEIAAAHAAHVSLIEVRMNQQQFSRVRLWVKDGD